MVIFFGDCNEPRDAKTCGEADELFQRLTTLPFCDDAQTDKHIVFDKTATRRHPFHASDEGPYRLQNACFSPRHNVSTDGSDALLRTSLNFLHSQCQFAVHCTVLQPFH
jgi:hypothetical protein